MNKVRTFFVHDEICCLLASSCCVILVGFVGMSGTVS